MPKAIDTANLDLREDPGNNFYQFANGGWLKNHPIPDEFSRYGTFDLLREENRKLVRTLIEEVAADPQDDNPAYVCVGALYRSGMDTKKRNAQGFDPIKPYLQQIDAIEKKEDISSLICNFYQEGIPSLFYLYPSPDRDNSDLIISNLHQGGMGLPDVEYYRNDDERSKEIRERYLKYLSSMFELAGQKKEESAEAANTVLAIESRFAHAGMTRLEQRDPHKTFNKRSIEELTDLAPAIDWHMLTAAFNLSPQDPLNIGQPNFFRELSRMLSEISVSDWKTFFKWRILNASANLLSESFEKCKYDFFGAFLSGKKSQQALWKRITAATEDVLGDAIGKIFVEKHFPPSAKSRMEDLVENLRSALEERITGLDWMSDKTKIEAQEKLSKMRVKIGYPNKWRDYSELKLTGDSYYENYRQASVFNLNYELNKIGKKADRDEWEMTPQTVNAYYHPLLNEIVFPAGILQPPFFFMDADDAVNYGAIGVVIGHEMTHGFDDQGRKFDKNGNLNDWWSESDASNFSERSLVLEEQFSAIKVADDLYADGKLSLGENIADLGGINIALQAVRKAWESKKPDQQTDEFTPLQRFFLSYAHLWANNIREKEIIRLTREDVHSLGINRVNGPLPNVGEFYEAFNITARDPLYLEEGKRAKIW